MDKLLRFVHYFDAVKDVQKGQKEQINPCYTELFIAGILCSVSAHFLIPVKLVVHFSFGEKWSSP